MIKWSTLTAAVLLLLNVLACQAQVQQVVKGATQQSNTQIQSGYFGRPQNIRVEVFSNSSIYLTNTSDAVVYQLDGLEQLEAELSQGLPSTEAAAMPIAMERLRRMGAQELKRRTDNASEGIVRASQYGIDRVPAIVFNGKAIVYGMTDVAQAKALYLQSSKGSN